MFQDKVSNVPSPVHIFSEDAGETGPSQISSGDGAEERLPVRGWKGIEVFVGLWLQVAGEEEGMLGAFPVSEGLMSYRSLLGGGHHASRNSAVKWRNGLPPAAPPRPNKTSLALLEPPMVPDVQLLIRNAHGRKLAGQHMRRSFSD